MMETDEPPEEAIKLGALATFLLDSIAPKLNEIGVKVTIVLRAPLEEYVCGCIVAASTERNRDASEVLRALANQIESGSGVLSMADEDCDS